MARFTPSSPLFRNVTISFVIDWLIFDKSIISPFCLISTPTRCILFFMNWTSRIFIWFLFTKNFVLILVSDNVDTFSRSSPPEVFLGKDVLQICRNLHDQSAISVKLLCNFIETTPQHGCSSVNSLIFSEHLLLRTPLKGCFWFSYLIIYPLSNPLLEILKSS